MRGWRAWYTEDRIFSSTDTIWSALPSDGMLGVVVYFSSPYRTIIQTCDWWWMDDAGNIYGILTHPIWGEWQEKPNAPNDKVKRGAVVADDVYRSIQNEMLESRGWP